MKTWQKIALGATVLYLFLSPKDSEGSTEQNNTSTGSGGNGTGTGTGLNVSYLGQSNLPRGIRNNNPGNIKIGNANWLESVPTNQNTDGTFVQFNTFLYGIRAMIRLLTNYQTDHLLKTPREIIWRWANNDTTYLDYVSNKTGFGKDQNIILYGDDMKKFVRAIVEFENGQQYGTYVTDAIFEKAEDIAF